MRQEDERILDKKLFNFKVKASTFRGENNRKK